MVPIALAKTNNQDARKPREIREVRLTVFFLVGETKKKVCAAYNGGIVQYVCKEKTLKNIDVDLEKAKIFVV